MQSILQSRLLGYKPPLGLQVDLRPIIKLITQVVPVEKIYRLDHAPALAGAEAFTDLLIVVAERYMAPFEKLEPLLEFVTLKYRNISCFLHDQGNLMVAIKKGYVFYATAFRSENLVYDKSNRPMPQVGNDELPALQAATIQVFNASYNKALDFYDGAMFHHKNSDSAITAFMLHQAAELCFRAIILAIAGQDKRTHIISALMKYNRRCAPQLNALFPLQTQKDKALMQLLDGAYLSARYSNNFVISKDNLLVLVERIGQLLVMAKQAFYHKIKVFGPIPPSSVNCS